jgi:hypothetical protein
MPITAANPFRNATFRQEQGNMFVGERISQVPSVDSSPA